MCVQTLRYCIIRITVMASLHKITKNVHPSQQFFSYVGTGLPWLNQYKARINVSCTRTHHTVTPLRLEPSTPGSRDKHSTTEPLRSLYFTSGLSILTHGVISLPDAMLCDNSGTQV